MDTTKYDALHEDVRRWVAEQQQRRAGTLAALDDSPEVTPSALYELMRSAVLRPFVAVLQGGLAVPGGDRDPARLHRAFDAVLARCETIGTRSRMDARGTLVEHMLDLFEVEVAASVHGTVSWWHDRLGALRRPDRVEFVKVDGFDSLDGMIGSLLREVLGLPDTEDSDDAEVNE